MIIYFKYFHFPTLHPLNLSAKQTKFLTFTQKFVSLAGKARRGELGLRVELTMR